MCPSSRCCCSGSPMIPRPASARGLLRGLAGVVSVPRPEPKWLRSCADGVVGRNRTVGRKPATILPIWRNRQAWSKKAGRGPAANRDLEIDRLANVAGRTHNRIWSFWTAGEILCFRSNAETAFFHLRCRRLRLPFGQRGNRLLLRRWMTSLFSCDTAHPAAHCGDDGTRLM